jgi:hypothetical protein
MTYKTSGGWIINPTKLKSDDREFLESLDSEIERVSFIDECVREYNSAWNIGLIDLKASLKDLEEVK